MKLSRQKVLALVLAGGQGSRLEVLTEKRAKPVMPFAGTYRLIDFSLSNCMHSGISDVWVIEQYQPHSLNEHLANGRPWDLDRTYGGLQVLPPYTGRDGENEGGFAEGNADAIYRHCEFLREFNPDILLVLSADHVYKLNYGKVIDRHRELEADVTMVTTQVRLEEAGRFGTVKVGDGGRITDFTYKPEQPESDIVTTEVFIYDAHKLLDTLNQLAAEIGEQSDDKGDGRGAALKDFGHALLPRMVGEGNAYEFRHDGYWRDVGTVESYWQAHADLLAPESTLALDDPQWPILTYGVQRTPARIHATARIENSMISPGCTIRGQVVRSVLGPGVVVEQDAVIRDSVVMQESVIGARATVDCAVLDTNVRVGEGAVIGRRWEPQGGGEARSPSSEEIALVGTGARVAAESHIPAQARVKASVG